MLIKPVVLKSPEGEAVTSRLMDRFQTADSSCQIAVEKIIGAVRKEKDSAAERVGRRILHGHR